MIDINPQPSSKSAVAAREYDQDEPDSSFYVEKTTNFVYEVKLFPEFAMIRLAMPDYQPPVQRIDILVLSELFNEYCGDVKELRSMLFGSTASNMLVEKKSD